LTNFDILCVSPTPWGERVRRPQHLMRVAARQHRVIVIEQAHNLSEDAPLVACSTTSDGIKVYRPAERTWSSPRPRVRTSVRTILAGADPSHLAVWVDHPRALSLVPGGETTVVCDLHDPGTADEGSLAGAELLLTDGSGGYEASRRLHPRAYLFPHAVDVEHFARARARHREPVDQSLIPGPRVGFWGTIDDRIDFGLVEGLASRMPNVHFVMIGPVERSGRERMGRLSNLHWLGSRSYADLPDYVGGWNAAFLPFARNDLTKFLSPPQIPEFLAAGRAIVSTPLRDVQHPYGASGLVKVADSLEGFVAAIQETFRGHCVEWLTTVDRYLRALSWEATWEGIEHLVNGALRRRATRPVPERRAERMGSLTPAVLMH